MGERTQIHESQIEIQTGYIDRMAAVGWLMEKQAWPMATWRNANTEDLFAEWRENQKQAEMTIVMVPPDGDIQDLPLKALGYVASALSVAESLRERSGINVTHLRILSPVHVNVAADGGDKELKLRNAAIIRDIVQAYAHAFHPNLHLTIHSDSGNTITSDILRDLSPDIERLATSQHVQAELQLSAIQHDETMDQDNIATRTGLYLLAHGPAWGYSQEEPLFASNGVYRAPARIVYAPTSELRFFALAAETGVIYPQQAQNIVTLISGKQSFAPYYRYGKDEPRLKDVLEGNGLIQLRDTFKKTGQHGSPQGGDVVGNINILITAEQQAAKLRRGQSPTILGVLKQTLQIA